MGPEAFGLLIGLEALGMKTRLPSQAADSASFLDLLDEALENQVMKRFEDVPVDLSEEALRVVVCLDEKPVEASLGLEQEFQPRFSGKFHLCPEQKSPVGHQILDSPETDDVVGF